VEKLKTLSLVLLTLLSFKVSAQYMYGGGSFSRTGIIATDQATNGGSDWAPGLHFGINTGRVSTEIFTRKMTLENEHIVSGTVYDIDVENLIWGIGFRLELIPWVDGLLGMVGQNASTTYETNGGALPQSSIIDKHYLSWYLGGGIKTEVYPDFIGRLDLIYYKGDLDFGLLAFEFGLMYKITTF
jgi:hypothetical protein